MRFYKTITVPLTAGTVDYNLPTQSGLTGATIVSIRTRRVGKTLNRQNLPTTDVFNAAFLSLRDTMQRERLDMMPLAHIEAVNIATGKGLEINIPNIDFQESKIVIQNPDIITTPQAVELTFEFEKQV